MSLLIAPVLATPLLKVPLIFSSIISVQFATKPPNPPANTQEKQKYHRDEITNAPINLYTVFTVAKFFGFGCQLCDAAVILAKHVQSPIASDVLSILVLRHDQLEKIKITPIYLAGWAIMLTGSLIRLWSYKTLGKLFTFELSVRQDHKLVTTGPYSLVRHPAYSGTTLITIGSIVTLIGPGSWWKECGLFGSLSGKILSAVYATTWILITFMLWARIDREDAAMRAEFGDEWKSWARKTPYKIIPFVF